MPNHLKVSVAMITYNGVDYIEAQLTSILEQTHKPDEVIISDDGSTDGSIELLNQIIEKYADSGIRIILLTDNPSHGINPNYSWAVQHTMGDIIFSSGQDDVWREDKIEKVLEIYYQHPDAQVVSTDLAMIDRAGKPYFGHTVHVFVDKSELEGKNSIKLDRAKYLAIAETATLIPGPALSFKRILYDLVIPLPMNTYEDQWIEFVGLAEDSLYFLNEKTTYYRVHDSASNSVGASLPRRIQRACDRIKIAYKMPISSYGYRNAIKQYYDTCNKDEFDGRQEAISVLDMIMEMTKKELHYMKMGRINGCFHLIKWYAQDVRYRKSGLQSFLASLFYIAFFSKKRRVHDIDTELLKCYLTN